MWKKFFDIHFWLGVGSVLDLFGTNDVELPTSGDKGLQEDANKLRQDWEKIVKW